jgi:hypothetical protein
MVRVYNVAGTLIKASPCPPEGGELAMPLLARGIYIVTDGAAVVKVVY